MVRYVPTGSPSPILHGCRHHNPPLHLCLPTSSHSPLLFVVTPAKKLPLLNASKVSKKMSAKLQICENVITMLLYKLFMNTKKLLLPAGDLDLVMGHQDLVMGHSLWRARSASLYWDLMALPPVVSRGKAPGGGQGAKPPEADELSANKTLVLIKLIYQL